MKKRRDLSVFVLNATLLAGCGNDGRPPTGDAAIFQDMAAETGLQFTHYSGATGRYFMTEIMGAGVALVDFDGDDDLDVFVLQGSDLEYSSIPPEFPAGHRLYRNEIIPTGELRFVDVTASAGIENSGYGVGVATGDVDNDGDLDIYVTHFGPNLFLLNDGDGSFKALETGSEDDGLGTSASFLDYDADGRLDLFVANYNNFSLSNHRTCLDGTGALDYCGPLSYEPSVDRLFRNLGNARFADVTREAGIDGHFGTGLGVVGADFDRDGHLDIYVANDKMANIYWKNAGDGRFSNVALVSGAAYNANGVAEASMGLIAGDVDGDGDEDMFMTHLTGETNTLYLNDGNGNFSDSTDRMNLGAGSLQFTSFGTVWIDYDNDGDHDVLIANGTIQSQGGGDRNTKYGQRNQLFCNDGRGRFDDVSAIAGPSFQENRISRGAAVGDIDNDGDLDAVVTNTDGPIELLINSGAPENNWLSVKLQGIDSNRDGAGARVALLLPDGKRIWRRAHTDGSYLSASDIRVHFGLGAATGIRGVGVIWPSGRRELWTRINPNSRIELVEGEGEAWED